MLESDLKTQILESGIKHLPPGRHMERFLQKRRSNHIRRGAQIPVQVFDEATNPCINAGETVVCVDQGHLEDTGLWDDDATYKVNGEKQEKRPHVYYSADKDLVTKGSDDNLLSLVVMGQLQVDQYEQDVYVTTKVSDVVDSAADMIELRLEDEGGRNLRGQQQQQPVIATTHDMMMTRERSLFTSFIDETDCGGTYHVVTLGLVVDSYFCAEYGGLADKTAAVALTIVQEASERYEPLCTKLKVVELDVYCDSDTDPIRPLIGNAMGPCGPGSLGLLQQFGQQIAPTITGNIRHLIHGYDFPGSTIGCAYTGGICRSNYNERSGISEMSWSPLEDNRGNLLAHEVGHGIGCSHTPDTQALMYQNVQPNRNTFKQVCRDKIHFVMNDELCIKNETTTLLAEDDFETGTGTLGGLLFVNQVPDQRIQNETAYEGQNSLHLLHNTFSQSNVVSMKQEFSFEKDSVFRLSFYFMARGMNASQNDNFQVQAKNYSASRGGGTGTGFKLVRRFDFGTSYYFAENEIWYKGVVESQTFAETTNVKFRLTCFGGSPDRKVFVDNVKVEQVNLDWKF